MSKENSTKRTLKDLLEHWGLKSLKINAMFLEATFEPSPEDQEAAWEMYIELITRVSTQHLLPDHGDEITALESIHSLFEITRNILKNKGRKSPLLDLADFYVVIDGDYYGNKVVFSKGTENIFILESKNNAIMYFSIINDRTLSFDYIVKGDEGLFITY